MKTQPSIDLTVEKKKSHHFFNCFFIISVIDVHIRTSDGQIFSLSVVLLHRLQDISSYGQLKLCTGMFYCYRATVTNAGTLRKVVELMMFQDQEEVTQ